MNEKDTSVTNFSLNIDKAKPVCNDHLYNKICYLWCIQYVLW